MFSESVRSVTSFVTSGRSLLELLQCRAGCVALSGVTRTQKWAGLTCTPSSVKHSGDKGSKTLGLKLVNAEDAPFGNAHGNLVQISSCSPFP